MKIRMMMQRRPWLRGLVWMLCAAMVTAGGVPAAFSGEICGPNDLADVPLELVGGINVPALFMISFDNSDSMCYEIMTNEPGADPDTSRLFNVGGTQYENIFTGNSDDTIEDNAVHKNAWKSQWHGHNKMYYNPFVGQANGYKPWPTKPPANKDNPPWSPQDVAGDTYPLTGTWLSGYVATEQFPPAPAGDPIYMDDSGVFNTTGSTCSWQPSNSGYGGTSNYTYGAKNKTIRAAWGPVAVNSAKAYNIEVYREFSIDALKYTVYDNAASLGEFPVPAGIGWTFIAKKTFPSGQAKVGITDGKLAAADNKNSADAIRLTPAEGAVVNLQWTAVSKTIKNRHFYVKSNNGAVYLVNLVNDDSAEFYLVNELWSMPGLQQNDIVEKWVDYGYPELVLRAYADLPFDLKTANGGPLPDPAVAGAYSTHVQNFANWFTYYRTRRSSAQNAMGIMVTEMKNMLVGFQTSPPTIKKAVTWINTTFDGQYFDNTHLLLSALYNIDACGSARGFSEDITDLGKFFEEDGGTIANASDKDMLIDLGYATTPQGTYPFFTQEYGGNCQKAFALIITDGASPSTANIKNYDGTSSYGDSAYDEGVFGDSFEKTAADGAMQFYERDLKPGVYNPITCPSCLDNDVPMDYMDFADHQHMVTYGLSFGVQGPLRQAYPDFDALCANKDNGNICRCPAGCPVWTDPLDGGDVLDDLWHATVNGRGVFLYADNPQDLVAKLREISSDIERRKGSAAAVTTNSVQRQIGTTIYQGLYHSETWWGDVMALEVDPVSGRLVSTNWRAQEFLPNTVMDPGDYQGTVWEDRKVFTSSGGLPTNFTVASAGNFSLTGPEAAYILGDQSNEGPVAPAFRERLYVLGDIVHSEPFYFDQVIYVGANDGMMHALNAATGRELFAYIPSMVHANLNKLTLHNFIDNHIYYVNASPHVAKIGAITYLAGGLGKGGKGVYCLTVDNAKGSPTAANTVKWEIDASSDNKMGYVYGRAYVVNTNANKAAVIFGNGYASTNKTSALYVIEAATGIPLKVFDTGVTGIGGCNGMSSPALIDVNIDSKVDYLYAGDLDGNLWKFDLTNPDPNLWTISYSNSPMFTARDSNGHPQAITSEPDVMRHCDKTRKGFIVAFGTGRYLNADDLTVNMAHQAMYGLYDWEADWPTGEVAPPLGIHNGAGNLTVAQTLLQQTKVSTTGDYDITTDLPIDYYLPPSGPGQHAGWFFSFPDATEIMVRDPLIRNNVVYFVTNTQAGGMCSSEGASYVNALNACNGGRPKQAEFDVNGDGKVDENDTINGTNPSRQYFETTLFDPILLEDILYINDTEGNIEEQLVSEYPPGTSFWMINE